MFKALSSPTSTIFPQNRVCQKLNLKLCLSPKALSVTAVCSLQIQATAQGLAKAGKPPNGVVSPNTSQQGVVVGGKVVTASSPGSQNKVGVIAIGWVARQ